MKLMKDALDDIDRGEYHQLTFVVGEHPLQMRLQNFDDLFSILGRPVCEELPHDEASLLRMDHLRQQLLRPRAS